MAIINLKTGAIEGESPIQVTPGADAPTIPVPTIGNLIDLNTGEII